MRLPSHSKFAFDKLPPELRVHIRSFLKDDRATLVNAIRVNKEWFHQLIGFLWRKPEFDALLRPTKRGRRRQFYADKIRTLSLDFELAGFQNGLPVHWRQVLSTCEIPYLEHLRLPSNDVVPDEFLCPLLRLSLLSIKLPCVLSASAIELGEDIFTSPEGLPYERALTNEVLARLLKHGRLTHLKLGKYLSKSDAQEISNLVDTTLPGNRNLTSLSIGGHYDALSLFLANTATSLRTLKITVPGDYKDCDRDLCEEILRFTNLTEFSLCMWPEQVLHPNDLAALGRMKQLQVFKITSYWKEDMPASNWTNDDFGAWISNFPELRELELLCESSYFGAPAMAAIGRACPNLEKCTLGWAQDLSTWTALVDDTSVLFPKLEKLGVHSVDLCDPVWDDETEQWDDETKQAGTKQLNTILALAPHLKAINFVGIADWDETRVLQMVLASFKEPHCEDCFVWELDKKVVAKIRECGRC